MCSSTPACSACAASSRTAGTTYSALAFQSVPRRSLPDWIVTTRPPRSRQISIDRATYSTASSRSHARFRYPPPALRATSCRLRSASSSRTRAISPASAARASRCNALNSFSPTLNGRSMPRSTRRKPSAATLSSASRRGMRAKFRVEQPSSFTRCPFRCPVPGEDGEAGSCGSGLAAFGREPVRRVTHVLHVLDAGAVLHDESDADDVLLRLPRLQQHLVRRLHQCLQRAHRDAEGDVRLVEERAGHGAVVLVAQELQVLRVVARVRHPYPGRLDEGLVGLDLGRRNTDVVPLETDGIHDVPFGSTEHVPGGGPSGCAAATGGPTVAEPVTRGPDLFWSESLGIQHAGAGPLSDFLLRSRADPAASEDFPPARGPSIDDEFRPVRRLHDRPARDQRPCGGCRGCPRRGLGRDGGPRDRGAGGRLP